MTAKSKAGEVIASVDTSNLLVGASRFKEQVDRKPHPLRRYDYEAQAAQTAKEDRRRRVRRKTV